MTSAGGKFEGVQVGRDLESNWEVDLAKKLEDYLFKICSGEVSSPEDVNFAEAALLLQGSVQVYSRKVEYLYGLVLHALEFLSDKRQQDELEDPTDQPDQSCSTALSDEDTKEFWAADDVPVEPRNRLDASTSKDSSCYQFLRPPANLVVLEGDCLDANADGGELESFLLATNDLYRDFILLDLCDAVAVDDFLKGDETGKEQNGSCRRSSICKSFMSPTRQSGGTARKSSMGKNQGANEFTAKEAFERNTNPPADNHFEDDNHGFDMHGSYPDPTSMENSDSDEDDPWKPLNPYEPGNLKVKPFREVNFFKRNEANFHKRISISTLFPLARMEGTISPELTMFWEARCDRIEKDRSSQFSPLYEKLRQSLANGGHKIADPLDHMENNNDDGGHDCGFHDFGAADDDNLEDMHMDQDLPFDQEKQGNDANEQSTHEAIGREEPNSQTSLEDLCRSHLDALLSSIAESEKQTELAARVSSWKHKIEKDLQEQESRPPFDIHAYGEKILGQLSLEADPQNGLSFADVVIGQQKHDVARSFSALLQLVNNGDVHLDRDGLKDESVCYTAVNPFHVRLLSQDKREEAPFGLPRKRVKSPVGKGYSKGGINKCQKERSTKLSSAFQGESSVVSSQQNCKFSVKTGKIGSTRCTPEGKRRRKTRLVETVGLHSTRNLVSRIE